MTLYKCCSQNCPGYRFKASELAHPVETCGPRPPAPEMPGHLSSSERLDRMANLVLDGKDSDGNAIEHHRELAEEMARDWAELRWNADGVNIRDRTALRGPFE